MMIRQITTDSMNFPKRLRNDHQKKMSKSKSKTLRHVGSNIINKKDALSPEKSDLASVPVSVNEISDDASK